MSGSIKWTLDALGLDKQKTIAFVNDNHPTYMQFEDFVVKENGGSVAPDKIAKHNSAVTGYDHDGTFRRSGRDAKGVGHQERFGQERRYAQYR